MDIKEFYTEYCHQDKDGLILFPTDFEYIELAPTEQFESIYKNLSLESKNVVRFLNKSCDLRTLVSKHIEVDFEDFEDFDNIVETLEAQEKLEDEIALDESARVYFLPSHMDTIVKNIVSNNQRKKIDKRLQDFLPQNLIQDLELNFIEKESAHVKFEKRGEHSISLFKFFIEKDECSLEETIKAVNKVKVNTNSWKLDSFFCYVIGDIEKKFGLLEKAVKEKSIDPRAFHYNFWKLQNSSNFLEFIEKFTIYEFEKKGECV